METSNYNGFPPRHDNDNIQKNKKRPITELHRLQPLHPSKTDGKKISKSKSKYHYVGKIVSRHHANSKILINKTTLKYTK